MVREPSVVAIGEFDGFHLGHQDLIDTARVLAGVHGQPVVAVVVAAPDHGPHLLPPDRRCVLALQAGADGAVVVEADRDDPADLVGRLSTLVRDELGARAAVLACGPVDGQPTRWPALRPALACGGVEIHEVGRRYRDGVPVTSDAVIADIRAGDVEAAAALLGRPVEIDGVVAQGEQLGRQLGFPTANVVLDPARVWPAFGVYAGYAVLPDGRRRMAAINVGVRPTVTGDGRPLAEAHLLDFADDIYGARVRLDLVHRLRGEQRFDSFTALVDQIGLDVRTTRTALEA